MARLMAVTTLLAAIITTVHGQLVNILSPMMTVTFSLTSVGDLPSTVIDLDLDTNFASDGSINGEYIQIDMGSPQIINTILTTYVTGTD